MTTRIVRSLMAKACVTCGSEIVFRPGKGWRHGREPEAGAYLSRCDRCGWTGSTCENHCPGCGSDSIIDEHVARPDETRPGWTVPL